MGLYSERLLIQYLTDAYQHGIYLLNRQFLMVEIKTIQFLETSSVLYLLGCFKGVQ